MTRAAAIVCLVAGCATAGGGATHETGFLDRSVVVHGETFRYQVFVPSTWTPARRWPVILFLHGAGERGSDGLVQTEVGIGSAIRRSPERYQAVVVMPQCRKGAWWNQQDMQELAIAALDRAVAEWNGDPGRLLLTGLSMGGYATWSFAFRMPGKFAALAPICGGVRKREVHTVAPVPFPAQGSADPWKSVAAAIGKTPVWVFHGARDDTIPVAESRGMVAALRAAGGDVRYTEYPDAGHDSWTAAYSEPDLPTWLLAQHRP